ncbi:MAG: phospholipase D-like domain-containing protein [Candidatus Heimdallarchaeum endolithica]|uniref:Phospholipase D-like domain-containing protein n=1 Tax=Candidatus Heimdallarchaeum endolithica TaxID=2876572 RepID=A0A9Y1BRQ0_9ARCH|nr:MAG: phospholipase D-like domain-containing protein [Candidatus Heimdallarchaeum endolithica]
MVEVNFSEILKKGSIIDNRRKYKGETVTLKDVVRSIANGTEGLKCATGYFYIEGLALIIDKLKDLKEIKILMGSETTRLTKNELIKAFKEKFNEIEENSSTIPSIVLFHQLVKDSKSIKIRVYFGDDNKIEKLHSKAYLFIRNIKTRDVLERYKAGIIGSSNLTPSGLIGNTELNVIISEPENLEYLESWFDSLWERGSEEFDKLKVVEILLEGIEKSKFGKYLKEVYHYVKPEQFFKFLIKYLKAEYLFEKWEKKGLLKFQIIDTLRCATLLAEKNYRGVFLTSSVGLGKSYVACALAEYFLKNGGKILVIAPAGLVKSALEKKEQKDNWPKYLSEFGIFDKVDLVSMGDLQEDPLLFEDKKVNKYSPPFGKISLLEKKYNLIIIDEAHNYRNEDAFRTRNLKKIIDENGDAKVLFLTATPINTSLFDLLNLIKLIYRKGQNPYLDKLVRNLVEILNLVSEKDYENLSDEDKKLISKKQEEIERELFIKSTRETIKTSEEYIKEIEELSGIDIRQIPDPEVREIAYKLDKKYKEIVEGIIDFINSLTAAHLKILEPELGTRLGGFFKWILYKRFESDITSYYLTLKRLSKKNKLILTSIKKRDISILERERIDEQDEIEVNFGYDFRQKLGEIIEKIKSGEGKSHLTILEDLEEDTKKIDEQLKQLEKFLIPNSKILFIDDKKLEEFLLLINKHIKKKILIFVEYKDSLKAIKEFLKDKIDSTIIKFVDSQTKNKNSIIEKFNDSDNELKILVTTDTLSEGYNISGADIVVNFDIPYNPVKLIQRIGRATRLDTPKRIRCYNFRPDDSIDQELNLVETLEIRIEDIIKWVGIEYRIWFEREKELLQQRRKKDRRLYLNVLNSIRKDQWRGKFEKLETTIPYTKPILILLQNAIKKYNIKREDIYKINIPSCNMYTLLNGDKNLVVFYGDGNSFNENSIKNFTIKEVDKKIHFTIEFKDEVEKFKQHLKRELEEKTHAYYFTDSLDRMIRNIEDKIQTEFLNQKYSNIESFIEILKQVKDKSGSNTEKVVREIHKQIKRNMITEEKIVLWIDSIKKSFTKKQFQQKLVKSKNPYMAIGFTR